MSAADDLGPRKLLVLLGVPVDDLTMDGALDRLENFVLEGRRTGRTFQVVTVNTDFIVNAVHDPETRLILQEADMAVADGMPVVWSARWLGCDLKERVAGADMIPLLAERAAQRGFSIYFLGAAPGVAARASQILSERYPGLQIVGAYSPPYVSILEMDPEICDQIRRANPDILLVAFGNPKQEKWIAMHRSQLGVPVQIGVGGTLDFVTGETTRAPAWMQRSGLEWFHRLLNNPGRLWRRYIKDFLVFGILFLQQWWRLKFKKPLPAQGQPGDKPARTKNGSVVQLKGAVTVDNIEILSVQTARLLDETNFLVLDLTEVVFLDSAAIGTLVHLAKEARALGGDLLLASVPEPIRQTLALLRLDHYFQIVPSPDEALTVLKASSDPGPIPVMTGQTVNLDGTIWEMIHAPRRFDAGTSSEVKACGQEALARGANLLVDLGDTIFLASAGLAVLALLHRTAVETERRFAVTGCCGDVLRVLKFVQFDRFLTIYPSNVKKNRNRFLFKPGKKRQISENRC